MADGVLTSSLEWTLCILFFGMQALPKNRGACVDNWFWQYTEWKGFQHEKVSYRRVEQLWCLGYRHSTSSQWPKLYSEWQNLMFWVLFGRLRPQYELRWRSALKELSLSRQDNWFSYINHLNPSSYAKVIVNTVWTGQRPKYHAWHQTHVDECLMQCVSNSALKTAFNWKNFNTRKFRLVEPIDFHI